MIKGYFCDIKLPKSLMSLIEHIFRRISFLFWVAMNPLRALMAKLELVHSFRFKFVKSTVSILEAEVTTASVVVAILLGSQ